MKTCLFHVLAALLLAACSTKSTLTCTDSTGHQNFSGIYPHLAFYNSFGECGTGAVVPWADRLWAVTYSPHQPFGSDDKLYEISPSLERTVRKESIGGTPANRGIHRQSNQLFIGPYAIDQKGTVRTMPYDRIPGRPTGVAQHLTDPEHRILLATMESGFYDIDVNSLDAICLYKDGNQMQREGSSGELAPLLPGYHGKGFYSGQGVAVFSNNGEEGPLAQKQFDIPSGCLAEWDGKDWKVVRRNQFTEVTGPGGLQGNPNPETDPIWATGWDYKSVILAVREPEKGWSYYRLSKASFAYDGAHGWNTEWPRIRNVGDEKRPEYLMTMHGMFWHFPSTFSTAHSAGIQPRGSYLKVIGDFTRWGNRLVFGCDDSAQNEFLNVRKQKGGIGGAGQSNSNLWFTPLDKPDHLGPTTAGGSVWLKEEVKAGVASDPFLFQGWENRCAWIANRGGRTAVITFQTDRLGNGTWTEMKQVEIPAASSAFVPFGKKDPGVWIRAISHVDTQADLTFVMAEPERRSTHTDPIFKGIASIQDKADSKGLMWALDNNRKALGLLATTDKGEQYYELDSTMTLTAREDSATAAHIGKKFAIPRDVITKEEESILIVDAKNRRWRLPLGDARYTDLTSKAQLRICREVSTERDLFSCHGTFYELPAENADGFAKIRPISSHHLAVNDYASYRGMMMLTGINHEKAKGNPHIVMSADGKAAVWAGVIDDLWKLGKPVGHGGPWASTPVKAGEKSDPFLIGFYDRREMSLSHSQASEVTFCVETDPTGDGQWFTYAEFTVKPGQTFKHTFPQAFQARWIRLSAKQDAVATALFDYR